ncbi:MAG: aconitate hydratase [Elusimicrobiota bacterium]
MKRNLTQKILEKHLISGKLALGEEVGLRIDQTLTQDATGTLVYLQFESLGIPRVKTKLSVSYVDHNTLQTGFENADDHLYLQSVAAKYGVYFSRPGNGICHQIHLERFGVPGQTLVGSDSHTPTAGGLGMLAFGAGGLDVAVAMGGGPFYLDAPKVVGVCLKRKLPDWVSAKDLILELLRRLTVKGGVRKIFEYTGEGVVSLSVPERATITNMGAELGATTSIFPSDEITGKYLQAQGRRKVWKKLLPDEGAEYEEIVEIDLAKLSPMIARPHSPDNVCPVKEIAGTPLSQVVIGSCTNSSFKDLMTVAAILKGKTVHPAVSLVLAPGSKQVLKMLAENGALSRLISSGARLVENACGPCIGMGQAPASGTASLRTFNRNFLGRSGTADARIYLASPETAAVSALKGVITSPQELGNPIKISEPKKFPVEDNLIIPPVKNTAKVAIRRGPNIVALPVLEPLVDKISGPVLIKLGDNITTDHILPAGAKILPLRSNLPAISAYVFERVDPAFSQRAKASGGGFVIAGENYGQGSSREHAALAPRYLGVKAVIAKSFARIHLANLINFGILPLTFVLSEDYQKIYLDDKLEIDAVRELKEKFTIKNSTKNFNFAVQCNLTPRQREIILAGGLLNYTKRMAS